MSETMRKQPELNKARLESVKNRQLPTASGNLARALADYIAATTDTEEIVTRLNRALGFCWNKKLKDMETLSDFYTPPLRQSVALLIGEDGADRAERILKLRLTMIFSPSPFRRSYHTETVGNMASQLFDVLVSCITWHYYELTTAQAAEHDTSNMRGFLWQLALELFEKDAAALDTVREAILGDNSRVLLSVQIIRAIVISGNSEALELLGKLLLAAKQQEGIRQQILENMDWGTVETTKYFLQLIYDNDLTRFSSVIRAMDTWTGLGYGSTKPALAKKCVRLAVDVLGDPTAIERYVESSDNLELYFALWGAAVRRVEDALELVERFLSDEQSYYDCLEQLCKRVKRLKEQTPGTVLHTDQGSVYSSRAFSRAHLHYNIIRSMSRAGTPTDNPIIESLNGWMKAELVLDFGIAKVSNPKKALEQYVKYFNYDRFAAALDYKTPIQYKTELGF